MRVCIPLYYRVVPNARKDGLRPNGPMHSGVVSHLRILVVGFHGGLRIHCNHHSPTLPTKTLNRHELDSARSVASQVVGDTHAGVVLVKQCSKKDC